MGAANWTAIVFVGLLVLTLVAAIITGLAGIWIGILGFWGAL